MIQEEGSPLPLLQRFPAIDPEVVVEELLTEFILWIHKQYYKMSINGLQSKKRSIKDNDLKQTYHLFKEIFTLFNAKMQMAAPKDKSNKMKESTNGEEALLPPQKPRGSEEEHIQQTLEKIAVRQARDWQGLCSQRKQDILGQYPICFDYSYVDNEPSEPQHQNHQISSQSDNN